LGSHGGLAQLRFFKLWFCNGYTCRKVHDQ
jgi:hypothetical protein